MSGFIEITKSLIKPDRQCKVIKHHEYARYLDAQDIIEQAQKKAQILIEGAKQTQVEAQMEGFQRGIENGQKQQLNAVYQTLDMCAEYISQQQPVMVNIIQQVVQKLLGEMPSETRLIKLLKQALTQHENAQSVLIHVSSEQVSTIEQRLAEVSNSKATINRLQVRSNSRVQPGECLLEFPFGTLEVSLESQLQIIETEINKVLESDNLKEGTAQNVIL